MRAAMLLLFMALPARGLAGDFPAPHLRDSSKPCPGVEIIRLEYAQPRPLRAWAVRIDLTNPDLEFVVTPRAKVQEGFETLSATTLAFAEQERVQVAINGSPFSPFRARACEPMNINGLNLSRGDVISPPDAKRYGALLIGGDNQASIRTEPIAPADLASARHGIGGFSVVLVAGKNLMAANDSPQAAKHPRTAVGLSDNGKAMWWLVVDGRQAMVSEGLSYRELGDWALSLGIAELLNLDGGGSTTLVRQDPATGKHEVLNKPVSGGRPGTLRQNGNSLGLRVFAGPKDLTAAQLQAIMPKMDPGRIPLFLGPLNRAMVKYGIDNPARRAAFLAQLAHESGELKYMEEIASGEAYEGRKNLGNNQPGDGKRFKGRGPIQLTGRFNYRKAGTALGVDLEGNPEKAADPEIGCQVAGWFWETHGLNALADAGNFREITRKVNGGFKGLERREGYWVRAKKVLGVNAGPNP